MEKRIKLTGKEPTKLENSDSKIEYHDCHVNFNLKKMRFRYYYIA